MHRSSELSGSTIARFTINRVTWVITILSAFGLRLYQLEKRELSHAESLHQLFSLRPLSEIAQSPRGAHEVQSVASYLVEHFWLSVTGDSVFALRFVSAWFGILALALIYRLMLCLGYKRQTAMILLLLMAISPYAIGRSQDTVLWNMLLVFTMAVVWLAIEWLQRQRIGYAVGYVLCAVFALYTHFYAAYVLLALYVFVLSRALFLPGLQNSVINLLAPNFFIALLYTPWYERAKALFVPDQHQVTLQSFYQLCARSLSLFITGKPEHPSMQLLPFLFAIYLCLIILAHLFAGQRYRRTIWLLILYIMIPFVVIWFDVRRREFVSDSSITLLFGPFLILIASGTEFLIELLYSYRKEFSKSARWNPGQLIRQTLFFPYLGIHHVSLLSYLVFLCIILFSFLVSLGHYYQESHRQKSEAPVGRFVHMRHTLARIQPHKL